MTHAPHTKWRVIVAFDDNREDVELYLYAETGVVVLKQLASLDFGPAVRAVELARYAAEVPATCGA